MKHKPLSISQKKKLKEQKHQKLVARAAAANTTPPTDPQPDPPPEKKEKEVEAKSWLKRWWGGLSPDGRTGNVVAVGVAIFAIVATIGWDIYKGDKTKESTQPAATAPSAQEPHQASPEPQKEVPTDPVPAKPRLIYVPLHNAPHEKPDSFLAYFPKQGTDTQTVDIGGERVPVMTQADLESILAQKTPLNDYVKLSGRTELVLSIGKDGKVENVRGILGNKVDTEKATEAVEQWEFMPFVKDGKSVAVKTVIQLDPKIPDRQEN